MSFTPGPWVVGVSKDNSGWPVYRLRDMQSLSDVEIEANAHLIAVAPTLLSTLSGVREYLEYAAKAYPNEINGAGLWLQLVSEAIAKAEAGA